MRIGYMAKNAGKVEGVYALDTLALMHETGFNTGNMADPFGGVILTDWHTPNEAPSERFKLNVYILDRTLRADGVR